MATDFVTALGTTLSFVQAIVFSVIIFLLIKVNLRLNPKGKSHFFYLAILFYLAYRFIRIYNLTPGDEDFNDLFVLVSNILLLLSSISMLLGVRELIQNYRKVHR